jgi:proline iminopeptidase
MNPDEHTIRETFLEVGGGHTLYIHDWGHAEAALPIIFLHGGPGGSVKDKSKQFFDPTRQRVIFFDQRGCGKSLPYGSLEHNLTADLVADIDKIADHFELERFILVGGSWGSCLALAYGIKHPQRVAGMVLNGIFTGSEAESEWIEQGLFRTFRPDVWDDYLTATPAAHRDKPSEYHFKNILGSDPEAAKRSAFAYQNLEGAACFLDDRFTLGSYDEYDPAGITTEVYYTANRFFLPDRFILEHAEKLTMPLWLVQGRYDMVCPPRTAYQLSQKAPHAELVWTTSGHVAERESWNLIRTITLQLTESART